MADRGLFSYNTQMTHDRNAEYCLVAVPDRPLQVNPLSSEIREVVNRTKSCLVSRNRRLPDNNNFAQLIVRLTLLLAVVLGPVPKIGSEVIPVTETFRVPDCEGCVVTLPR